MLTLHANTTLPDATHLSEYMLRSHVIKCNMLIGGEVIQ